jgi:hypothetical protein
MSKSKYVIMDEARWRVVGEVDIDGEPGYELARRMLNRKRVEVGGKIVLRQRTETVVARQSECLPDNHEPVRTWRNEQAVVRYYPRTGVVTIGEPHTKPSHSTTLRGLLLLCAHKVAHDIAVERAHRRRNRGRS